MSGQKLRLGIVVAVVTALIAVALPAMACSCVVGDPRDQLAGSDAAFIGEVTSKQVNPNYENKSVYTFRVIERVKGRLGKTVDVNSPTQGASCGIGIGPGQRAGLFLYRNRAGNWTASLCSMTSPREMREAAKPLPAPDGSGHTRLLVGGSFGKARVTALNAAGRTIDYGFGGDQDVIQLDTCKGSKRIVEVAQRYNDNRQRWRVEIASRAVAGARELHETVARFLWKKRYQYFWPRAVSCQSRDASEAVMFVSEGYGTYTKSALAYVRDGRITKIEPVTAREAAFGDGVVYLTSGKYGRNIARIDLTTGRKKVLVRGPRPIVDLNLSSDGKKLIGIKDGNCVIRGCTLRLALIRVGSRRVTSIPLHHARETESLAWWGSRKIVVSGVGKHGSHVHTYDLKLDRIGVTRGTWYSRLPVVLEGKLYGLSYGEMYRVRLPNGRVRELGELPSPVTNALVPIR